MIVVAQWDSLRTRWSGREDSNFRPQRPERCALNQTALRPEFVTYCHAQRPERCALNQTALRPYILLLPAFQLSLDHIQRSYPKFWHLYGLHCYPPIF
jgi:hypothetical protein